METGKLLERGDEGNCDDDQGTQIECDDLGDLLDGEFYRSREFWMMVTIQGSPNHSKFSVTHYGLALLVDKRA